MPNKFLKQYPQLIHWVPKVGDPIYIKTVMDDKRNIISPKESHTELGYNYGDKGHIIRIFGLTATIYLYNSQDERLVYIDEIMIDFNPNEE